MPQRIARNTTSRVKIGNRPINFAGDAGSVFGASGFVVGNFAQGHTSFTAPDPGLYKFVGWGPGGTGNAGAPGSGGGYFEVTVRLSKGQVVPLTVGRSVTASATTVTLPSKTVTANAGAPGAGAAGGTATNGDLNLQGGTAGDAAAVPPTQGQGTGAGAVGGAVNDGGGAPGQLPFRGGNGATGVQSEGPGVGAVLGAGQRGGDGLLLVVRVGG